MGVAVLQGETSVMHETPPPVIQLDMKPLWYITVSLSLLILICTGLITGRLERNAAAEEMSRTKAVERIERAVTEDSTLRQLQELKDSALMNQNTNTDLRALIVEAKVKSLAKKQSAEPRPQ
jgi:hypothetical protein